MCFVGYLLGRIRVPNLGIMLSYPGRCPGTGSVCYSVGADGSLGMLARACRVVDIFVPPECRHAWCKRCLLGR